MHRQDYRGDTGDLIPLTVPRNRIPQHLQVDKIAIDGNVHDIVARGQLTFILVNAVILCYSDLWCFLSANILSVIPPTQWYAAIGLGYPIFRNNMFLWSCRQLGERGGGCADMCPHDSPCTHRGVVWALDSLSEMTQHANTWFCLHLYTVIKYPQRVLIYQ